MLDGELAATRGAFDHAPDDLGLGGIVLPFAAIKLLDMGLTALGVA